MGQVDQAGLRRLGVKLSRVPRSVLRLREVCSGHNRHWNNKAVAGPRLRRPSEDLTCSKGKCARTATASGWQNKAGNTPCHAADVELVASLLLGRACLQRRADGRQISDARGGVDCDEAHGESKSVHQGDRNIGNEEENDRLRSLRRCSW